MRKLTTHEVQKIEYDILVTFDQFCEANHLTYMLAGGTLLGAIRHHGFIPWDDDIDVIMPRNDYDRLLQLPKTVIGNEQKKYEIWHWKNSGSHYPFIKIVDPDTYVKTDYIRQKREIPHIWIDVFPLDGNPNDRVKTEKLYKKVARYRRILSLRNANPWEGRTWYVRITKPFVVGLLQVLPNHFLCSKMDSISKTYSYQTWIKRCFKNRRKLHLNREISLHQLDIRFIYQDCMGNIWYCHRKRNGLRIFWMRI